MKDGSFQGEEGKIIGVDSAEGERDYSVLQRLLVTAKETGVKIVRIKSEELEALFRDVCYLRVNQSWGSKLEEQPASFLGTLAGVELHLVPTWEDGTSMTDADVRQHISIVREHVTMVRKCETLDRVEQAASGVFDSFLNEGPRSEKFSKVADLAMFFDGKWETAEALRRKAEMYAANELQREAARGFHVKSLLARAPFREFEGHPCVEVTLHELHELRFDPVWRKGTGYTTNRDTAIRAEVYKRACEELPVIEMFGERLVVLRTS
jgi:hypothetical protein